MININTSEDKQLAVWTFEGVVAFEDYAAAIESINEKTFQKKNILDLRAAKLTDWTPDKFLSVQHVFERISHLGGKTAVVTDQDYHIGLVRMSENIKKAQRDWDHEIRFFRTMSEAKDWLGV